LLFKLSTLIFALLLGYHLLGGRQFLHKIKVNKTLSRSQGLNATGDNQGLTNSFSTLTEQELKILVLNFLLIYFLTGLGQNHI
jgi:hypothetical protein